MEMLGPTPMVKSPKEKAPVIQLGMATACGRAEMPFWKTTFEQARNGEAGQQQAGDAGAAHRPEGDALHGDSGERAAGDGDKHGQRKRQAEHQRGQQGIARQRHQLAMGEIDQADDGKDDRQPKRQQRIDAAEAHRIDDLLRDHSFRLRDRLGGQGPSWRALCACPTAPPRHWQARRRGRRFRAPAPHSARPEGWSRPLRRSSAIRSKTVSTSLRRKAERGLVEQDQARLGHQCAGDGQHLLLAAGEIAALDAMIALAGSGTAPASPLRAPLPRPPTDAPRRRAADCRPPSGWRICAGLPAPARCPCGRSPPAPGR